MEYHRLEDTFVCFVGIRTIGSPGVSNFISSIQSLSLPEVTVQLVNARSVYGPDHLLGILKITLECQKRSLALSHKPQTDLLLRLSFTNQIALAFDRSGLKKFLPAVVILYSTDKKNLARTRAKIMGNLSTVVDNAVLAASCESRDYIFQLLGSGKNTCLIDENKDFVTQYLIERSALIVK
jgi:tRNA threonylcarbamoyladenosine modification (KEOPS) complex Cgi121 subunit